MNAPLWMRFASTALTNIEAAQTHADKGKAVASMHNAIANLQRAVQLLESERDA